LGSTRAAYSIRVVTAETAYHLHFKSFRQPELLAFLAVNKAHLRLVFSQEIVFRLIIFSHRRPPRKHSALNTEIFGAQKGGFLWVFTDKKALLLFNQFLIF
jgi:hypothetical protein